MNSGNFEPNPAISGFLASFVFDDQKNLPRPMLSRGRCTCPQGILTGINNPPLNQAPPAIQTLHHTILTTTNPDDSRTCTCSSLERNSNMGCGKQFIRDQGMQDIVCPSRCIAGRLADCHPTESSNGEIDDGTYSSRGGLLCCFSFESK